MKTTSPLMTVRKTDPNLPYSTPVVAHPLPRPPPCRLFPPGKKKCHDTRHRDPDSPRPRPRPPLYPVQR